jgi:hypothetical protein
LDKTRKNRRLLDTFVFPRGIGFDPGFGGQVEMSDWHSFNEESVILTSSANEPDNKLSVGLHVAFDETGPLHGKEFTAAIRDLARTAKNILVLFCPAGT